MRRKKRKGERKRRRKRKRKRKIKEDHDIAELPTAATEAARQEQGERQVRAVGHVVV
jgi:hypothetical protein